MPHGMTLQGRLPDYPGSVKPFYYSRNNTSVKRSNDPNTRKETRQSLGAPHVTHPSNTNGA